MGRLGSRQARLEEIGSGASRHGREVPALTYIFAGLFILQFLIL